MKLVTGMTALLWAVLLVLALRPQPPDPTPPRRPAATDRIVESPVPPAVEVAPAPAPAPQGATLRDLFETRPAEFLDRIYGNRADFEEARRWLEQTPPPSLATALLRRASVDPSAARLAALLPLEEADLDRLLLLLGSAGPDIQNAILSGLRDQPRNLGPAWERLAPILLGRDRSPETVESLASVYPYLLKARHALAPAAETVLLDSLHDAAQDVREAAVHGLGAAADRHLQPLSAAFAQEPSLELRLEIVRVLRGCREFLSQALASDRAPEVRRLAADLGRDCFGPHDRPWLARLLETETDPEVSSALARVVVALDRR